MQRGSLETPTGIRSSDEANLAHDRELLAGWVLLIDKSLAAMETAVVAVMSGASPGDLAALTAASVELQVLAARVQDIRKKP